MRIVLNAVFLTSERFGGTWTYTYNLARSLALFKDEVELIILANQIMAHRFQKLPHQMIVIPLPSASPFHRVLWEQTRMLPLLSSLSPDVFHSTANVLPFGIQSSSVLTINDFQYKFFPENFSWIKRHYLDVGMRLSIRYATKVICISETTKRHAIEICGADKKKLHVVDAAGLALGEYEKHTGEDVLRNRYTLESPFILYAASGFPHKNLLRLVEAFGLIANDIQQDLVITGEPFGISKELDRAVQKHLQNAKKRVHITGFIPREDLLGLYSIADCYILPSLFEGFGISLLEAMACGCPVIASNSTALPGTAGNAALYCNPESIESIAISLKRLLSNEKLRSSLISLGLQRANSFSWERVARETVAVYRSIIEN